MKRQSLRICLIIIALCISEIVFSSIPPPSNDNPCSATTLNVTINCNYVTYSTSLATASAVSDPGCAGYLGGDVWFTVTVPSNGSLVFDTESQDFSDGGMAIYSGNCTSLTLIACDDDNGSGHMPKITATGLIPGSTIWVRIWENGNNDSGNFGICVTSPQTPSNDEPCNAILLPVQTNCNFTTGTNVNALGSNVPDPGCGNYSGGDVWYKTVVPANGYLDFNTQSGGVTNAAMAVYKGTCSALTLLTCDEDDGTGNMPEISLLNLTPNDTIWIRIWEEGNNTFGTFGVCVNSQNIVVPPSCSNNAAAGNTCATATTICNLDGYCGNTSAIYTADYWSELNNTFQNCVNGIINNDSYLKFVAASTSASFNIWVTSSTGGDGIQMMFFEANNCSGPVICHGGYDNLLPSIQPHLVNATNLVPGRTYYLMIDGVHGDECNYVIEALAGLSSLSVSPNASICKGEEIILSAGGIPGVDSIYHWTWIDENGNSQLSVGSILHDTPMVNTTYTITAYGVGICPQTKTVLVTVKPLPVAIIAPPDTNQLSCSITNIQLDASGGIAYTWYNGNQIIGNDSFLNVTLPSNYLVTVTAPNGCKDTTSIVITQDITSPIVSINNPDTTALNCNITSIQLSANGNGTFSWNNGTSNLGTDSILIVNAPATYIVQLTGLNGCVSNDQINITQDIASPLITVTATPSSVLSCSQNTINLSATGGINYSWSIGSAVLSSSASFSVSTPANYTVTVKGNNGCENNASINVTQNANLPDASVTSNGTICKGDNAVFVITGTAGAVVNYTLNNSTSQFITLNSSGSAQVTIPMPLSDQSIQLNSVSLNACIKNLNVSSIIPVDNFSINLIVNPISTNPGNDISAQISSNGTIATSTWSPSNLFNQNISSQTITAPDQTFQIEVTATSANGCVANQSQIVEIISTNNIYYIPNSFIPGTSGNADITTFKLYGSSIKKATMQIFNQWGQCIFESESPHVKGWDGKCKGIMQPSGVYVYTVKITFNDKKTVVKSGSINLIR